MVQRSRLLLILPLLVVSCRAYQLDSAQHTLRGSFAEREFSGSAELLERLDEREVYRSKDYVLLNLEQGTVHHFGQNYQESNYHFTEAEEQIDFLFTRSVSRAISSFLNNDNTLDYDGEDFEDIYINVFKALNYIHMDDLESALVEARRIAFKLDRLNLKYNTLTEALAEADTANYVKWESGSTNVQNSAMGHYLAAVLYAKTGNPDDARIEYENLLKSFRDQPSVYTSTPPGPAELQRLRRPESYNVLVSSFSGRGPRKIQNDLRMYLDELDFYLRFSLPTLQMYESSVQRVEVTVNDTLQQKVDLIEEMDLVARDIYRVKEPVIYARTMIRALIKSISTRALSKEIGEENESLGDITNLLGIIGQEATEKADLRSWQTMPGKAFATVLFLPPGTHEISVNYYSSGNHLLFSDRQTVDVFGRNSLELVESLYWN